MEKIISQKPALFYKTMLLNKIKTSFYHLTKVLGTGNATKTIMFSLLDRLLNADGGKNTIYEFSLQFNNNRLNRKLKFGNIDNFSSSDFKLYNKRLTLLKNIVFYTYLNEKTIRLFNTIENIKIYRLPLYFGVNIDSKKRITFKIYLNLSAFFIKNRTSSRPLIKYLLKMMNLKINLENRRFPLIAFDISGNKELGFKIYYLYDRLKDYDYLKKYKLLNNDIKQLFEFMDKFTSDPYFVIVDRYLGNNFISHKVEMGVKNIVDPQYFLKKLLTIFNNFNNADSNKLLEIPKLTNSYPRVVAVERGNLAVYFRIRNYTE